VAARQRKQDPAVQGMTAEHSKDELASTAEDLGVDVKTSDTKTDIAEKIVEAQPAANIVDDGVEDIGLPAPVVGQWVDLEDGRHAAYLQDVDVNKDGSPKTILVRTRDARSEEVEVAYDKVRATTYSGGR
jgi:hypothetical protein